jgi:short subunit dehydrogenase-like uncharacterized protein
MMMVMMMMMIMIKRRNIQESSFLAHSVTLSEQRKKVWVKRTGKRMERTQGRKLRNRKCDKEGKGAFYEARRRSGKITTHILNFGSR